MAVKVYYEADASLDILRDKTLAVIGYGSQGHAHALNLRDSGLNVVVGLREGKSADKARMDGFEVLSVAEAAAKADVIMVLINDEFQGDVYKESIAANLKPGDSLWFSDTGSIFTSDRSFRPPFVDVFMVAPKGPGHLVRRVYQEGKGVPCLDRYSAGLQLARRREKALIVGTRHRRGTGWRSGNHRSRKKPKPTCSVSKRYLCGGATALVKAGFETLVEAGYQPEIAYFRVLARTEIDR